MQEEELGEREKAADAAAKQLAAQQSALSTANKEKELLEEVQANLRGKLEESKQQLKGNEQMIRWLNAQVHCRHATR